MSSSRYIFLVALIILPIVARSKKLPELIPFRKGNKWGFCDSTKKIIIEPGYDKAHFFHEGLAHVEIELQPGEPGTMPYTSNTRHGFIDRSGKVVIPAIYLFAGDFNEGLAPVLTVSNEYFYINTSGERTIRRKYEYAEGFYNGLAIVGKKIEHKMKYGVINKKGEILVPFVYDRIGPFREGLAWVIKDSKAGYINTSGTLVVPAEYVPIPNSIYPPDFTNGYVVLKKDKKCGMFDRKGKLVIPFNYISVYNPSEGLVSVNDGTSSFYLDTNGRQALPYKYDHAGSFYKGVAVVAIRDAQFAGGDKYYLIDREGKKISENYSFLGYKGNAPIFACDSTGKHYGFLDTSGKVVLPFIYDRAYYFEYGIAEVVLNGEKGIIDKNGKFTRIPSDKNIQLKMLSNGLIKSALDGKICFYDREGNKIIHGDYLSGNWVDELFPVTLQPRKINNYSTTFLGYMDKYGNSYWEE